MSCNLVGTDLICSFHQEEVRERLVAKVKYQAQVDGRLAERFGCKVPAGDEDAR